MPETWGRLATILVKGSWERRWSPAPVSYSARDIEEIRVCRACGTHYHFRQDYDPHFSEPRPPETDWHLERLTPPDARTYHIAHTSPDGVAEHLDGGWLDQHYETIIGLLRRDLPRAPDWQIKRYVVDSLYKHCVNSRDWEDLRATLIDCPDPAVSVYVAYRIFAAIHPEHPGRAMAASTRYWDNLSAMVQAEPTREPLLVTVLAAGLSARGQSLGYTDREEPVAVSTMAMHSLRTDVARQSLAPAIQALAAEFQWPNPWWRETARDLLIGYVGAAPERAKEVLEVLASDTDETLVVRNHCQQCLARSAG